MAVYNDGGRAAFGQPIWQDPGYDDHGYHQHHEDGGDEPAGSALAGVGAAASRLTNVAGALVSLALIAGLGVWGYKLMVRDVTGIPVVQALQTPMRVAPKDPGGDIASHQGLAVNAIAAEGAAEAPAERLVLAPQPIELTDEDQPQAVIASELAEAAAIDEVPGDLDLANSAEAGEVEPTTDEADPVQTALDVSDMIAASVMAEAEGDAEPAAADGDMPRVSSLIPKPRPARLAEPQATIAPEVAPVDTPVDMNVDDLVPGTRLVQFGAYDSPEIARTEWDKLVVRFEPLMEGKVRVIQQAKSGGKVFYRLRAAGFDDLSDARRFCAALVTEKAACIPTQAR